MNVRTLSHVNDRTADGRPFAALDGVTVLVDDADENLVALMHSLAGRHLVEILAEEEPPPPPPPAAPDAEVKAPKATRPAAPAKDGGESN